MFEAVGVTVSRLIRTRFGDIVLPRTLRRGRWDELDASLVTALMVQLGLLREDDDSSGGNRRRSKQPQSHDSALPPGFGTMDRNGMNGARIGRRGKLQRRPPGQRRQAAACPSDPFGTGLMIAGGYANGHPLAGGGALTATARAASPAAAAPRRAARAGPGRAASPLAANPAASRAAIARLHPRARRASGLLAGGGRCGRRRSGRRAAAAGGAKATGKPAGARGSRGGAKAARAGRGGNKAEGSRAAGKGRRRSGWQERGAGRQQVAFVARFRAARRDWQPRAGRARVAPGRARWRPGSSGALSPGRRLLEVVPPSWRSGCWRGLPADSSRLIVSP